MTTVEAVDPVFYFILGISVVILAGIAVAMVWFAYRYNRSRCPVPASQKDHNLWLEVTWTVIPTIIVLLMFWFGWEGYLSLRRIPDGAMPVQANARMWSWLFTYENGKASDKMYVPVGKPVKVKLLADDVLHSFYLPAFRVKRDCVPGMETFVWFVAQEAGSYHLFCAEYCGLGHADMITTVEALPEDEFEKWLHEGEEQPGEPHPGLALLEQHRCLGCHSLDGSKKIGPTLQGIGDRETIVVAADGSERTIKADREYIVRSILDPKAEVVKGYKPVMRSYEGKMEAAELEKMVDYLAGGEEAAPAPPVPDGTKLLEENSCLRCHSTDGSKKVGPTFKNIFGREVKIERDGTEVTLTSDREYLRRAIVDPKSEVVVGYRPVMRAFELSPAEVEAIIDELEKMQ